MEGPEDRESLARKIAKYNHLAVPVLEQDGSVVGFVTVDDVVDVLIEDKTEDLLQMAAPGRSTVRTSRPLSGMSSESGSAECSRSP
jgi:magnesium transporter